MRTWTKVSNVESLYQHSNGRYYVRLYGGQDSFRSLRTKKISVAKQRLRDYLANRPPPGRIAEEATLEELFDRFLRHPDFGKDLAEKSKERIRSAVRSIRSRTGLLNRPCHRITTGELTEEIDSWDELSNGSKNYLMQAYRKAFAFAKKRELIAHDPTTEIKQKPVKPRKLDLPSKAQFDRLVEAMEFPEHDRAKARLTEIVETKTQKQMAADMGVSLATFKRYLRRMGGESRREGFREIRFTFLFLCYSGVRIGEARAIRWQDVEDDEIKVRGTKSDTSFRTVPVIPQMKELLEEMRNLRPPESPDETVLAVKTIGKSLKTACGQLGLPPLTHQDLRHYFATKAIQSGVDVPTVAKWLGHNDGGVLAMRTYGNVVDEHQRSQAKKVRF